MSRFAVAVFSIIFLFSSGFAIAGPYRDCMKTEMKMGLEPMACDFSKLNSLRNSTNRKCAQAALKELSSDPNIAIGTPEFKSQLDNIKRGGNGDIDEMATAQATKCGVILTIKGDVVLVTPKAAN